MVVGILRLVVDVPESSSLKDKRAVIRSLKARIEARFHVSVAEVGDVGRLDMGELGIACVSNDGRHADRVLVGIAEFAIANPGDGTVADYHTELLHFG